MAFASTPKYVPVPDDTRARYAFTVADYHQLIASGHFTRADRIELINGELTIMPPIGPEHSFHTTRITNVFPLKLPSGMWLRVNEPITIPNHSEPQPDAVITIASNPPSAISPIQASILRLAAARPASSLPKW